MKRFVVITGGLGNQLFQIAGALSLSDDPIFVVSCLGDPKTYLGEIEISKMDFAGNIRFTNCEKNHNFSKIIYSLLLSSATRRKFLHRNLICRNLLALISSIVLSVHLNSIVYPRVSLGVGLDDTVADRHGNLLVGYFQTFKQSNRAREVLNSALNKIELLKSYEREKSPDLVIHSRLGDYKDERDFGVVDSKYFSRAIETIEDVISCQSIWLFSDEPDLAIRMIPEKYKDRIKVIGDVQDSPVRVLATMRNARAFVISNSTFSWWAAYSSASDHVVAPNPWFAQGDSPTLLIPVNWIEINRY